MKELAIQEILKIHKGNSKYRKEIIEALGEVGGELAIKELVKIHKGNSKYRKEIILALGQAGKNI